LKSVQCFCKCEQQDHIISWLFAILPSGFVMFIQIKSNWVNNLCTAACPATKNPAVSYTWRVYAAC